MTVQDGRNQYNTRVGTAGWAVPRQSAESFAVAGSNLERYAGRLAVTAINSTFYKPHRPATYARWAASVPPDFRFAVKLPQEISHVRRLIDPTEHMTRFLAEIAPLGDRLGPLLLQLPPSLVFDAGVAGDFFANLRSRFNGAVVCEPRHPSWFEDAADDCLREFCVARVAADPSSVPRASEPGGWPGLVYLRLHGAPKTYFSPYTAAALDGMAGRLRAATVDCWCIFDNTGSSAAAGDALALLARLK